MIFVGALQNNPYWGKKFFPVVLLFIERMFSVCTGKTAVGDLAPDEIQICVLALVAIASATIGTFLVMKKMTMLANSLSHTVLLGIVIAYLFLLPFLPKEEISPHAISVEILLAASLITGLITTALTQFLTSFFRLQEDASTGLVFTMLFALGIVLITALTRNAHIGTEAIMGNVDALHLHDLRLIFWIALTNLVMVSVLYKEWKVTTFDAGFAHSIGFSGPLFNYLLMVLTSVTVIGAFRAVGVLLVLAFLVAPALTARLFTHRLKYVIFFSIGFGVASSVISVALARHFLSAYHLPLSTAGLTVTILGAFYFLGLGLRGGLKIYQRRRQVLIKC
jgi:manganese/zinc/iron transport system permease protein